MKFARPDGLFKRFVEDLIRNLGVKIARRVVGLDHWISWWYDLINVDGDFRWPLWERRMYLAKLLGRERDIR